MSKRKCYPENHDLSLILCPLCNGLTECGEICPACGHPLHDNGPVRDYKGPYGPYEPAGSSPYQCLHLLLCPSCRQEIIKDFARPTIE